MMPFLTESIWRILPLPETDLADSLMVAKWPSAADLQQFADEGAENSISALREIVTATRAVRARYTLSPKTRIDVIIKAAGADAMLVENLAEQIKSLAGIGTLEVDPSASKPNHAATTVAAGAELFILLEGLVDFEAEKARISKEIGKAEENLAKLQRKLSNEGFLAKAAPEIIEKDRANAAEIEETVSTLKTQLDEIGD